MACGLIGGQPNSLCFDAARRESRHGEDLCCGLRGEGENIALLLLKNAMGNVRARFEQMRNVIRGGEWTFGIRKVLVMQMWQR